MPDKSHHNILEEDSGEIQEVCILYFTFCNSFHSNRPVRNLGDTEEYLLSNFILPTQLPESKVWEHTINIAWHAARAGPGSAEPNVVDNALFLPGCFSPSLHRWRAELRTGGCCGIPHSVSWPLQCMQLGGSWPLPVSLYAGSMHALAAQSLCPLVPRMQI